MSCILKEVEGGAYMQKRMIEALLKTCIQYGPIAVNEPENYEARSNLMWASSWAINGFLAAGFAGPWSCHPMEHQLSAYYDVTHGVGLAILTPHWMRHILVWKDSRIFCGLWCKCIWNRRDSATVRDCRAGDFYDRKGIV